MGDWDMLQAAPQGGLQHIPVPHPPSWVDAGRRRSRSPGKGCTPCSPCP